VKAAAGGVFSEVVIFDKKGERLSKSAPNFAASYAPEPFGGFDYVEGRPPRTSEEAAIDRHTARKEGYGIGERVTVAGQTPRKRLRIVGIAKFGNVDSLAGAAVVVVTLPEAQRLTGRTGKLDQIDLTVAEGVTPEQLRDRLARVMPRTVVVRTSKDNATEQANQIQADLGFIKTALFVFAGVALFVGAFMIFNTFSITVAQRMREFAMLRTLGATRRQVLSSVVAEALLVGLVASAIGVLAGLALAPGLQGLFRAFEIELPTGGTVFEARTAIVPLILGALVTLAASLAPALRATRVPPVAALREGAVLPAGRRARLREPLAALLVLGGLGVLSYGVFGDAGGGNAVAGLLGAGAALIFLGVALASSRLVRPLAGAVGRPLERVRGLTARLARENATRNPARTAGTAAALMIGLGLVSFVTVFAAGVRESVEGAIDKGIKSELVLQNTDSFSPIPAAAGIAATRLDGVEYSTPLRFTKGKTAGIDGTFYVTGVEPRLGSRVFKLDWQHGSDATLAGLGRHEIAADKNWAEDHDIEVGDVIRVTTPRGRQVALTVRGTFKDRVDFGGAFVAPLATVERDFGQRKDGFTLIKLTDGADGEKVRRGVENLLDARFPSVEVRTKEQFKEDQAEGINQLLGLIYVLLSLSVIVSLFGIVNTLVLSIHERTRELGLLRAIGASRAHVRRIVRYEAVITALIGASLGMVLGLFFAFVISRPLEKEGFVLSYPVGTLLVLMVLAALAGVLAAITPARRASRLDVLEALAYE
jgi:putative ABC transport system permease protein